MEVFDLRAMRAQPYEKRDKNVFYQTREFKTRIIQLPAGGQIPQSGCRKTCIAGAGPLLGARV